MDLKCCRVLQAEEEDEPDDDDGVEEQQRVAGEGVAENRILWPIRKRSCLKRGVFSCSKLRPGVDVMITIFCDFPQFSAKKLAFLLNTNVMIDFFKI
jgi:hypothetical protein